MFFKDLNKEICKIEYNVLKLPQKVTMSNNRFVKYKYSATGDKLQAIYSVSGLKLIQPMSKVMSDRSGNDDTLSSSDINLGASLSDSFADPSTSGSSQNIYGLPVLDYCGNIVYSDKKPVKILFDGGYVTIKKGVPTYHFFLRDHLGNVRVVADANGNLEERNDYYPFGGLMGKGLNGDFQSYKYNGKELERQIGFDIYDYGARRYDAATCRFTTMDPLAEKYYSTSPYAYCVNNPVRFVDTDGKWVEDANGNLVAEKGDNAWTLAKYLNTSAEISTKMLNCQGYSINEEGILNLKVGDIFKVERESPKPKERMDLGFLGNNIRKRAGSEFSKNLFENYWNGNGDFELSGERFAGILLYVKENAPKYSNQMPAIFIDANNGKVVGHGTKRVVSFYSSSEYDKAFGNATLYYNSKGNIIGFFDHYDFDSKPWGERSVKNELITRAVETFSPSEAKDFKIRYGYSKR